MKDFEIYTEGLFRASVCSSLTQERVEARMAARECGTEQGWTFSKDKTFSGGQSNPCPCELAPSTHKHYLFDA